MLGFVLIMLLANLVVTGFARLPLSTSHGRHPTLERWLGGSSGVLLARLYETPLPQDWVGFATQMHHQASGGPSYLLGERRMTGWWYYYLVALAVKVPLTFWLLAAARLGLSGASDPDPPARSYNALLPLVFFLYLAITAVGSSRNYGVRYLLPLAPLAIVWVSAVGERCRAVSKRVRVLAWTAVVAGLGGYVFAVAGVHPHELTYFNALAGGPRGGRRILADSNLDWGQGLKSLARLQRQQPELADITLYYFGDTEPMHYGCGGTLSRDQCRRRPFHASRSRRGGNPLSGRLGVAPMGPLGPARILSDPRSPRPGCVHRRHHDRDLSNSRPAPRHGSQGACPRARCDHIV